MPLKLSRAAPAFDRVGGSEESFNPDTYQSFEDKAFLTKMYLSVPTFVDGRCLDRYRCRSDSMWHSIRGTKLKNWNVASIFAGLDDICVSKASAIESYGKPFVGSLGHIGFHFQLRQHG